VDEKGNKRSVTARLFDWVAARGSAAVLGRGLRRQAAASYNAARGTIQRRELQGCLPRLTQRIDVARDRLERLKTEKRQFEQRRQANLRQALIEHVVKSELSSVEGISEPLSREIIATCYRGGLFDLLDAHTVPGVGEKKMQAIRAWLEQWASEIQARIEDDFPGKNRVISSIKEEGAQLTKRLKRAERSLEKLIGLRENLHREVDRLGLVGVEEFVRAYKGDPVANERVREYQQGVFPPWGPVPDWYREVLSKDGDYGD
jgi:hypothetical protein